MTSRRTAWSFLRKMEKFFHFVERKNELLRKKITQTFLNGKYLIYDSLLFFLWIVESLL